MASASKHFLSSMMNLRFRVAVSRSKQTQQPTNPDCLTGNQPTSGCSIPVSVPMCVCTFIPRPVSLFFLRGIFSHVSSLDLWYRESMTSHPLAIWPKPQPVDEPFRGARLHRLRKVGERGFTPLEIPNP